MLRNSLSRLSTDPNPEDVLGHLLVELVSYADASVGHIFIYDACPNTLNLKVRCHDGQVFWTPAEDEPILFQSPIPIEQTAIFTQLSAQPRLAILNQHEFEGNLWQGVPEWLQAKGYQATSCCILIVGERPFGLLAMAFARPVTFHLVEEEVILALAQQIALVIQLTLLSEADKQKAIVREQERSAQERTAELAKANDALRRSIAHLTTTESLQLFLRAVLQEVFQTSSDIHAAAVFSYQPDTHTIQMLELVLNGEAINIATDPRAEVYRFPVPSETAGDWHMLRPERRIVWIDIDDPVLNPTPDAIAWHKHQGHQLLNVIPCLLVSNPWDFRISLHHSPALQRGSN